MAEIRKLEEELSLARYNEKDLERLVEARNLSESHDKASASLSSKKTNCLVRKSSGRGRQRQRNESERGRRREGGRSDGFRRR